MFDETLLISGLCEDINSRDINILNPKTKQPKKKILTQRGASWIQCSLRKKPKKKILSQNQKMKTKQY